MRQFVYVYHFTALGLADDRWPKRWKEIGGDWVDARPESAEVRLDITRQVAAQLGAKSLKKVEISLRAALPPNLAPKSHVVWIGPMPSMRAKAKVVFQIDSAEDRDRCFAIEEALFKFLIEREIGFVDGNDIGPDEYTIYCFGGRKAPLREAIAEFMATTPAPSFKLR